MNTITNPNYRGIGRNIVSSCCLAPVLAGVKREYPLGDSTWYQSLNVECCEKCEQECCTTDVCECCGEQECEGCA